MHHPYGVVSLLPPLVAIVLAITTRRVILSLLLGVFAGVVLMAANHPHAYAMNLAPAIGVPLGVVAATVRDHLWPTLVDHEKLAVFSFTLLMGSMVGIVRRCGGMRGLVDLVAQWANSARRGQLAAWALGMVVFFDDYANTLLLGGTLQPLFDRLKISREKLAYVVDSTAAPVSGLALVSTWVAGEIGYVRDGIAQLPVAVDWDPLRLFLQSIPYRFYVLWALVLVPLVAIMRRDFPAMVAAEQKARSKSAPSSTDAHVSAQPAYIHEPPASHWLNAVTPIVVTVVAIIALMYRSGVAALKDTPPDEQTLMEIFGNADAFMSLFWGALIGAGVAAVICAAGRLLTLNQIGVAAWRGALQMAPALAILWLASALSSMTGNSEPLHPLVGDGPSVAEFAADYPHQLQRLYSGDYLGNLLQNRVPLWALPTLVFLLAGGVAFSTGTSWGTMGILMPLAIGAAYRLLSADNAAVSVNDPILAATIGSVLAGAIFGDHCSPISDTTVMSSQACGCNHVEHVRTQLPYAVLAGSVSVGLGTLPIAFGASPWVMLPLGVAAMALVLRVFGKTVGGVDAGDAGAASQ